MGKKVLPAASLSMFKMATHLKKHIKGGRGRRCLAESHDVPALSLMPFSIRGRETSSPTRSDLAEPCGVVIADLEAASGGWPAVQHFAPRGGPGFLYEAGVVTWSRAQQDPPRTRLRALTA